MHNAVQLSIQHLWSARLMILLDVDRFSSSTGDEIHAVHIIVDPDGPLVKSAAHIRKDYELEATKQAVQAQP